MMATTRAKVRTYRDLVVWQHSIDLVELAYRLSRAFLDRERFGLASQLRHRTPILASEAGK